ncbi:hypothetical protein PF008_g1148 [Phytophthora fragariae]|uniref:Secreted protein n=1 Tax=Phytophthora fragariae TaxID=53985 RepID=A0A6G0SMW7_9STRA|nr:hypothetical protein PF008_g1148 [Phytophthora fragariae]
MQVTQYIRYIIFVVSLALRACCRSGTDNACMRMRKYPYRYCKQCLRRLHVQPDGTFALARTATHVSS